MKLYVWTGVLYDYSAGMIVAIAPDMDAALELGRESDSHSAASEMGGNAPEVIDLGYCPGVEPKLWYVHGGS